MDGKPQRWIALLGRRDHPTDGVTDYCAWLGGALGRYGYELETFRVPWFERGWMAALADLREKAVEWRDHWVLLQYTTLAWSRRGFPLHAPRILSVLQSGGARCGVVFHDFSPLAGKGIVGSVRESRQLRVLEHLYAQAERAIFTVSIDRLRWLPPQREKAVFIPVGANCPEPPHDLRSPDAEARTIAVYGITGGAKILSEVADIGFAVKRASRALGPLRLVVLGRGSQEADLALRGEFAGTNVEVETLGLLSPEDVSKALARACVMLFVRSEISTRRGSAIAGIACGLPIVGYTGPETAWPITEAGFVSVPLGDRDALSAALQKVLSDAPLRESLSERSRRAQDQYFSWDAIAARYADALGGNKGKSTGGEVTEAAVVVRAR